MLTSNIRCLLRGIRCNSVYYSTLTESHCTPASNNVETSQDLSKILKLSTYTDVQRSLILQSINEKNIEQLLSFDITKARATKLYNWKRKNGPLKELSDILYVEGFGLKVVNKFYKSLLEPATSKSASTNQSLRTAPFVTPHLDEAQRQRINSCLALRVSVSSISWARLELSKNVVTNPTYVLSHWHYQELNDRKLHLAELTQRCLYVLHQIPEADCYIMESPQMAQPSSNPGSIDQQNVNIQKAQVLAMLSFALMERTGINSKDPNLFYMRRFLSARLFNHLVGTERVSTEQSVLELMKSERDNHQMVFPLHLCEMFTKAERCQRELMGQALLLNLTFVRLLLIQDEASLAAISRGGSKKQSTVL